MTRGTLWGIVAGTVAMVAVIGLLALAGNHGLLAAILGSLAGITTLHFVSVSIDPPRDPERGRWRWSPERRGKGAAPGPGSSSPPASGDDPGGRGTLSRARAGRDVTLVVALRYGCRAALVVTAVRAAVVAGQAHTADGRLTAVAVCVLALAWIAGFSVLVARTRGPKLPSVRSILSRVGSVDGVEPAGGTTAGLARRQGGERAGRVAGRRRSSQSLPSGAKV